MARGDILQFNEQLDQIDNGDINYGTDVIKLGLVDNTLVPLVTLATPTWGDFSANQVGVGGGYPTGGFTLANQVYTRTAGIKKFDADDIALLQDLAGFTDA